MSNQLRLLPPELRIPIYEHVLLRNERRDVPALLHALDGHDDLYAEARDIYWKINTFGLSEFARDRANCATKKETPALVDVRKVMLNFW